MRGASVAEASHVSSERATDDASRQRTDPLVRGFLFADLRGYTAYAEGAGDRAAAALLARYRGLVREVVSAYAGAEVRTEGDSFYLVFPSPSAAVRAGLAIVAGASDDEADHADDPILVGVGIHAGESAETDEGYVGSAVNVAARICSIARPGEVLVSDMIRALTRTSLDATFTSRGRKSLKGVAEPIELWAVRPGGRPMVRVTRPPRVSSRRARAGLVVLGAGTVLVAVTAIAAITSEPSHLAGASPSQSAAGPTTADARSPATGEAASPAPLHGGELAGGTYRTTTFDPPISFAVGPGLIGALELPNALVLALADDPERADMIDSSRGTRLTIMRPTVGVHSCQVALPLVRTPNYDPLDLAADLVELLPTDRDGLIEWLRADDGIDVERMDVVAFAGGNAIQVDLRIAPGCRAAESAAKPIVLLNTAIAYLIRPGESIRWYLTELDGRAIVFAINGREELFEEIDRAARSLAFSVELLDGG